MNNQEIISQLKGLKEQYQNFLNEYKNNQITKHNFRYNRLAVFNQMHDLYNQVMKELKLRDSTYQDAYQDISI